MNTNRSSSNRALKRDSARLISALGLPLTRREAMRRCLYGTAGLLLADGWGFRSLAVTRPAKAKSVIQIWMWGGPCHIDTFDPKPEAGSKRKAGADTKRVTESVLGDLSRRVEACFDAISIADLCARADEIGVARPVTHRIVYCI